jgi:hypothetical protein
MRAFKLIPCYLFSLSVLTAFTEISFFTMPSQSYAWTCCGCSCNRIGCCCPGQCGCAPYQCRTNDEDSFQAFTKAVRDSEITKEEVQVRQIGACARRSWGLRVLGDAAANLRLESLSFDLRDLAGEASFNHETANSRG